MYDLNASQASMLAEYQQLRLSLNTLERKIIRAENMLEHFGAGSLKKLRKMRDTMDILSTTKAELASQLRCDN